MDNLAHTLVGAALGRAVADRRVPAAGWIGAIAGNAPDWCELLVSPPAWGGAPRSGPAYLVYHRGITHSFLGAAVEIVALTALVGLILRWGTRGDPSPRPPWRWIALCIAVTVASHLYLDWQGSYGLRPFLPWNARWYYGDWVAIVDPFFWVVPLVALAWGARRHWAPALAYLVTLLGVTTLVLWRGHDLVVWWVRLALVGCAALTIVGRPFRWEALSASPDSVAGQGWAVARHLDHPAVRAALITSQGRAIAQFARFLAAAVDSTNGGIRVSLWDVRYHTPGSGADGWATVQVS